MKLLRKEEWKDIPNYEGRYRISNKGRVKSLIGTEKILKPTKMAQKGYLGVVLSKGKGVKRSFYVHQLVCMAFNGHVPNGKRNAVHHIDHDIYNNTPENLESTAFRQNSATRQGMSSQFQGVCENKGKYQARIYVNGKHVYLGIYKEELAAARAYQKAFKDLITKQIAA